MGGAADLAFIFSAPTRIVFGAGASGDAGVELAASGGARALLVTDRGVRGAGLIERVRASLGDRCAGVFDDVPQDSGVDTAARAAAAARAAGADSVVSVGGGSVMDTAKAAALLLTEGGSLADWQGFQMLSRRQAVHVAVPTTAGTGSEVTFAALVKDHDARRKILLFDRHLAPDCAILDPALLAGLPAALTASTGIDALTHAVEAVCSLQAGPFSDALALHAVRLIRGALPRCVARGDDLAARGDMLAAASLAGQAFTNAMVGVVHAMAHSLGALFGVPHGLANGIVLPHGMRFNLPACPERIALVAEALGVRTAGGAAADAAEAAVETVTALVRSLGLPTRLRDAGVPRERLAEVAELSLSDGSIVYNPRETDASAVKEVLDAAW